MLKNKRILLILSIVALLFLIPSICNAAKITATETTKTSTGVDVKWSYELNESGEIVNLLCTNVDSISGTLSIPSTIDGKKVKEIGKEAFEDCVGLTGITIPNTVTVVGSSAFEGCTGLRTINLPDTIVNIGNNAFAGCKITNMNIPNNVTKIGNETFKNCSALKEITIPNNVTSIGSYAFYNCTSIQKIIIPNNVTSIGNYAFKYCSALKSIVIPNNVSTIGESAFEGCSTLTSVTLSNNLSRIEGNTFKDCKGLTSVIIPDSVSVISSEGSWDYGAFEGCSNLSKILIPDSVVTIEDATFDYCDKQKLTIYGNDGQASKKYAEANQINFDYIDNWDKSAVGDDVTPPALKSLKIEHSALFEYDAGTTYYLASAGTNISIKATFEEVIYGETAPTLTIKCGNGENRTISNGVIQGSYIVYTYTIKEQDKGIIAAVSMTGGDVKDAAGNKVEKYTCPVLKDSIMGHYVFANGSGSTPSNGQGGNNQSTVTLSSISITKAPTKVSYTAGEKFNKTGMVITAKYSDGTTKTITNYTVSLSGELKTTDKKVVITYTENGVTKTVEQSITVKAKVVNNSNNNNNNNSNKKEETQKDTTIKGDSKLPQTGVTAISLVIISLISVAVISKVKCGKYKDI